MNMMRGVDMTRSFVFGCGCVVHDLTKKPIKPEEQQVLIEQEKEDEDTALCPTHKQER